MARTVLIVTYYFPPLGMGGVQRMAKLAKYLPRFEYDVIVLTVKPIRYAAYDESLLDELPGSVRIVCSGSYDPARLAGLFHLPLKSSWKGSLRKYLRVWPDSKTGWTAPALRTARTLLRETPVQIILSSAPPMTGHRIAGQLAEEFRLPWVADFRDLWEMSAPERAYQEKSQIERSYALLHDIALQADAVVAVNQSIGERLCDDAIAISGGYDPDDFSFSASSEPSGSFTMVYLGTISPLGPIEPFFEAARIAAARNRELAEQMHFKIIGVADIRQVQALASPYGFADRVTCTGYLPHKAALQEATSASVLLLSVAAGYGVITPGKTFDCFALPGPILAAVPNNGEAERIITAVHGGLCAAPDQPERLADKLEQLYLDSRLGRRWAKGDISPYSRVAMASRFAALFDGIIDHG